MDAPPPNFVQISNATAESEEMLGSTEDIRRLLNMREEDFNLLAHDELQAQQIWSQNQNTSSSLPLPPMFPEVPGSFALDSTALLQQTGRSNNSVIYNISSQDHTRHLA